jgi:hypothetical protein
MSLGTRVLLIDIVIAVPILVIGLSLNIGLVPTALIAFAALLIFNGIDMYRRYRSNGTARESR